ncbi:hypothetical protein [Amycolatopsis decaplanina]|uniref:hypothetical protein n=1 Tax=Amycolatopsis decaplanina TaxID=208441 RepID=UPI000348570A|nr:hypothetical protein [Amycolatopsis decaplanina]
MFDWFAESGYAADVAGLRSRYPGLTRFEDYLRLSVPGEAVRRDGEQAKAKE